MAVGLVEAALLAAAMDVVPLVVRAVLVAPAFPAPAVVATVSLPVVGTPATHLGLAHPVGASAQAAPKLVGCDHPTVDAVVATFKTTMATMDACLRTRVPAAAVVAVATSAAVLAVVASTRTCQTQEPLCKDAMG